MTGGLWESGLGVWYGPGTPLVQRIRRYRPNRRGQIKLARWLRVGLLRVLACLAASAALGIALGSSVDPVGWHSALLGAGTLAGASLIWRCSLIRVVLQPGEIVRFGVWRHIVVPCASVKRLHHGAWRGGLVLETRAGEKVDFLWFENSLWDAFYDFSAVCFDAMRAHVQAAGSRGPSPGSVKLERRFTWSVGAELLAMGAAADVIVAVVAAIRG